MFPTCPTAISGRCPTTIPGRRTGTTRRALSTRQPGASSTAPVGGTAEEKLGHRRPHLPAVPGTDAPRGRHRGRTRRADDLEAPSPARPGAPAPAAPAVGTQPLPFVDEPDDLYGVDTPSLFE